MSALALISLLYLLPTIRAGFGGSDVPLAHARGFANYEGLTFWRAFDTIRDQLHTRAGGWLPFADVQVAFWLLQPAAPVARTVQVLFVVADIATFVWLVCRVSRSLRFAALSGVGVVVAMQLRESNDAILGGTFGIPATLLLVILALHAFQCSIERRTMRWLAAAVVLQTVACGASEIAWVLALAFPILATTASSRARAAWVFPVVPLFYIATGFALHAPPPASIEWLLQPGRSDLARVGVDLVGALPTSYRAFEHVVHDGVTPFNVDTRFAAIPRLSITGLMVVGGLFAIALVALSAPPMVRPTRMRMLSVAAFVTLLLFAGALFHESHVSQVGAIELGEADPAVFVGSFGAGLALAAILWCGSKTNVKAFPIACALGLSLLSYGNARANDRVVDIAQDRHETWNLIDAAGRTGVFDRLPSEATVVLPDRALLPIDDRSGFRNLRYFLYQVSGKRFHVASGDDVIGSARSCVQAPNVAEPCKPQRQTWVVSRNRRGAFAGGLTVGRAAGFAAEAVLVDRAIGFRQFSSDASAASSLAAFAKDARGLHVLERYARTRRLVVHIERRCAPIVIGSAFTPDAPSLSYGLGFEPPDRFAHYRFDTKAFLVPMPDASQSWRYGESRATLSVYPDSCGPQRLALAGTIATPRATRVTIFAGPHRFKITARPMGSRLRLLIGAANVKRIDINFKVPGSAASEIPGPMFDLRRFPPAHFVLDDAYVAVVRGR